MKGSSSAKRLLILMPLGGIGGTQRVVLELTRSLRTRGHQVTTVLPKIPGAEKTQAWFKSEGVEVELDAAVPDCYRPAGRPDEQVSKLRALIRSHRPEVINFHYPTRRISFKDLLAARLAGNARSVVTVQHPSPFLVSARSERWLARASATLCDRIIISTPYMGELLMSAGVAKGLLRTVPLGVRPLPALQSREQVRRTLGWAEQDFVMLAVARLVEHKGLETLIHAFSRVNFPTKRLVIVGDGPLRERLARLAAEVNPERITLLGHVEDLASLYAAADLFTLPSEQEGFGLVFAEAAFHGLPSVAAGVWGVPYVIDHERTGLLVPPRDPEALGEALSRLASDRGLLRRMGAAAQTRAEAEFTDEHMTTGYERILFDD